MSQANKRIIQPVQPSQSASSAVSRVLESAPNEIIISRVINAPREQVFAALSNGEHLAHWFGPEGITIATNRIDVRSGGECRC